MHRAVLVIGLDYCLNSGTLSTVVMKRHVKTMDVQHVNNYLRNHHFYIP